jgi:hypothetical protein
MTVLQIVVLAGCLQFEVAVETEKFVAGSDQDIVITECNTAQAPVATAALEIYLARVPVDQLFDILVREIDPENAAMALTLPTAAYNGCRNQRR